MHTLLSLTSLAAPPAAFGSLEEAGPLTVWIVVLVFVFLECAFIIGLFLPGDSLLLTAGVVLAQHRHHEAGVWALAAVAIVFAVAGNQLGYLIGKHTGGRVLARKDGRILNRENIDRAGRFLDRWGFWSIVLARWVPWVRTLAPLIAGAARMDNRRFIVANAVGAVVWVPSLLMLGYYGAGMLDSIPWLKTALTIGTVGFFVVGTGYGAYRYRQEMRKPVDRRPIVGEPLGVEPLGVEPIEPGPHPAQG